MKKRVLKGIFVTLAAAAVCVPLAACGGSGDQGSGTATTTGVTETSSTAGSATTESTAGTTEASSAAETTASGSSETTAAASGEVSGLTPIEDASVKNDSLQIDVKGYQVVPAGVGGAANSLKPVVVFYYDVTNTGDKEIDALSAWTELFDVYQNKGEDDRNLLGQGVFADESIPSENGNTPLKKGETKSYYKPYELSDDTTSVTIRSHDGLGGAKLGEDIVIRVMS